MLRDGKPSLAEWLAREKESERCRQKGSQCCQDSLWDSLELHRVAGHVPLTCGVKTHQCQKIVHVTGMLSQKAQTLHMGAGLSP